MNGKNFVNFHVLISHSPSCLNRDDMNLQKTAVFGGRTRVRISSQSLKRSMRTSEYYRATFGPPSVRTRDLGKLKTRMSEALHDRYEPALVAKALEWMTDKSDIQDGTGADAVAPWSVEEVAWFCQQIATGSQTDTDPKKLEKQLHRDSQGFRRALTSSVDIALSGRMATSGLMTAVPVDGALAVAHSFTTHAIEPQDVDWFTAVDDLTQSAGETGAGHLNTQQFSAGVFYRYASLNLRQLEVNLGLLNRIDGDESAESRKAALDTASHVFHMLATVVPTAKQQAFAAHNLAEFAIVSLADQPISLANAFEQPVPVSPQGGYLDSSISRLSEYWARLNSAYGLGETARAFSVAEPARVEGLASVRTLSEMERWIATGSDVATG